MCVTKKSYVHYTSELRLKRNTYCGRNPIVSFKHSNLQRLTTSEKARCPITARHIILRLISTLILILVCLTSNPAVSFKQSNIRQLTTSRKPNIRSQRYACSYVQLIIASSMSESTERGRINQLHSEEQVLIMTHDYQFLFLVLR